MNAHDILHGVLSVAPIGEGWHDFYLLAGTAAVTLVGLLFVALSLHVEILFRDEHSHFRELAAQAFQGYLYVLVTALIFLVPMGDPGWQLLVYGILNVMMLVRAAWRIPRFLAARKRGGAAVAGQAKRFPLPFVAYLLGILAVWQGLGQRQGAALSLLAPVVMMLSAATRTAWDLLEYVGRARATSHHRRAER